MYYPNVKMIKFKYMYGILHSFTYPPDTSIQYRKILMLYFQLKDYGNFTDMESLKKLQSLAEEAKNSMTVTQ